ncbi:MAG: hypothetical protein KAJ23_13755, partial [Maribacter sp.]|nr:hypothetical protein [Maribacter sp.]
QLFQPIENTLSKKKVHRGAVIRTGMLFCNMQWSVHEFISLSYRIVHFFVASPWIDSFRFVLNRFDTMATS